LLSFKNLAGKAALQRGARDIAGEREVDVGDLAKGFGQLEDPSGDRLEARLLPFAVRRDVDVHILDTHEGGEPREDPLAHQRLQLVLS
jgi:hypothetical protein